MDTITSRSNPKIKHMRALHQRKERDAIGSFLVEGIHHVGEAVESGAHIECLCYAPEQLDSGFALSLIQQQVAQGIPCYQTTPDVFSTLVEKENPQGILAVVRQRRVSLADVSPHNLGWGVALVAPQDPGNVGSILRTIDAVGAGGLLLLDGGVDAYHPTAVRASLGAIFWYPVVSATFAEFAAWARQHAYHVVGTSARGASDYATVDYARPLVLLLGSEREGLLPEQAAICQQVVRLPMLGRASSLNLSVAASVMLYAMLEKLGRGRRRNGISIRFG